MNRRRKVLVITGNRAEYGLLYPVLALMHTSKKLDVRLLVTGTHTQKRFGSTIKLIQKDHMPIAHIVPVKEHADMLEALSKEIVGISAFCKKEKPDLMLVWGDRDESFAGAIVAGHLRIPLAHVGGGDLSGYVVDEAIRHAITKFSQVHFPISRRSAEVLQKLGEERKRIHVTGTTLFDLIEQKTLMSRKALADKLGLDPKKKWTLFLQHPTPLDLVPLKKQIEPSLEALHVLPGEKILIYPNSDTGSDVFIKAIEATKHQTGFVIHKSLSRDVYLALLREVEVVVGNSSSGIVEAGFFKKPVIDIGNRQKGRERGINVLHAGYDKKEIERALKVALSPVFKSKLKRMKNPYGSSGAAKRIVKVLETLSLDQKLMYKKIP